MRKLACLLVVMILVVCASSIVMAATADLNVTAEVVTPIALTQIVGMDFGQVFKGDGPLVLDPATPPAGTTPAEFEVTGEPNAPFTVTLPATLDLSDGTSTLNVNTFTSTLVGDAGTLDAAGVASFLVGATLDAIPVGATSGVYTGTAQVTVVYNF